MHIALTRFFPTLWESAKTNPRLLPLLDSPVPVWTITLIYLFFVLKWGEAYMKSRPAYDLRHVLLVYNVAQVIINVGMFAYTISMLFYHRVYDFACCGSLPIEHPLKGTELAIFYVYYIVKLVDYLDTIFFVLRKSFRQVSFLHVYHHVFMVFFCYYYIHFYGSGGQTFSVVALNTLVHTVMYGYYFLAAYQPQLKQSLWWKKYITCLQLVQFVILFLHHLYPLLFRPHCQFPKLLLLFIMLQNAYIFLLFGNFYRKAYMQRVKKRDINKVE